jgi:hypothetical protein
MPIHHHRNIFSWLNLDVLNLEVDVGAALGQRSVVASKTEEELRDACNEGRTMLVDVSSVVICK